jgi:hypothetical protein
MSSDFLSNIRQRLSPLTLGFDDKRLSALRRANLLPDARDVKLAVAQQSSVVNNGDVPQLSGNVMVKAGYLQDIPNGVSSAVKTLTKAFNTCFKYMWKVGWAF